MTNIATVSDEELQHTREIYADLVAEGRELDPASELDRMHARGIFPFALELIDEVLRQRKWAREMVEMAASGGRLDGYRELADELAAKDGEIERLTDENGRLRADLLAGRNVVNAGLTIHTLTLERDDLRRQLDECSQALAWQARTIRDLESKVRAADAAERSINEALNSGDGSYRP